ncbi:RNA recognition motif 2-domain-containing protein [Phialemonium atrogriseum]|uniref:RNA recognition motif 2-domain-containing protein n=1 Tax=Phialemonium atrogriseum TaxID=1093897 RepID=A0AAJ0C6M7_9PEZI|nr:RNA recognition motif 2-domain-containing protein [Phialemonium atrogriseum]KAK1768636.1 RNA recognition motif 2-domain-containing protein [Phialemonium atrogriseum]
MAQAREKAFNPPSPHSSPGGADSYKHEGTPDTRLTAFSPDENSVRSTRFLKPLVLGATEPLPLQFTARQPHQTQGYNTSSILVGKDPFVSSNTPGKPDHQKLSPTASAFQPFSAPLVARGSAATIPPLSVSSTSGAHHGPQLGIASLSADQGLSRYLLVTSNIRNVYPDDVDTFLMQLQQVGFTYQGKRQVHRHNGKVYIRFTNIRDAIMVHDNAHRSPLGWQMDYIRPGTRHIVDPGFPDDTINDGLVFLEAVIGPSLSHPAAHIGATVYNLLRAEADIFAFIPEDTSSSRLTLRVLIEFCDMEETVTIINRFDHFTAEGIELSLDLYKRSTTPPQRDSSEGLPALLPTAPLQGMSSMTSLFHDMSFAKPSQPTGGLINTDRPRPVPLGLHVQPQLPMCPVVYQNPFYTGAHYMVDPVSTRNPGMMPLPSHLPAFGSLYHPSNHTSLVPIHGDYSGGRPMHNFGRFEGRRQNAMRVNRSSPYCNGAGHHNHVDVNRIREGTDVRTTIMLRNIPNKVDQAMLKRIVDESSWGKYDFMYLRIDFANDCNVGYAFINFVDPLDIIDFVNARGNQRWNCFKSDKVAEISYATIQGKDCLVQKFRNSSVMLEAPHYRPKLYFTSNGPAPELAGQEESFPEPDNQSKMKRSCENAEHVGLFTPNAGQHFRDEQRRRRSQYDRGTRLAALEEFDYEASMQRLYVGQ